LEKALEMMKKTTHLSMTVRANRMGFKEAILFAQQLHSQLSPQQQQDGIETSVEPTTLMKRNIVATRAIAAAGGMFLKIFFEE
jgi:hypothetical protein